MLKYTRSLEDSRGLHIEFGEPITPANFLAACNAAIDLAKVECSTQTAVAIVFEAQGVEVQVTETDSAEVQLALWARKLSNTKESKQGFLDNAGTFDPSMESVRTYMPAGRTIAPASDPHGKVSNYIGQANARQFDDGDLVLARNGLNPQIRFAIGKIEGNDVPGDKVVLRLLHVLRAWGNDGHGRPDAELIQAIYSGLGNYAEFRRDDVMRLSGDESLLFCRKLLSELAAQHFSQRKVQKGQL